MHPTASAGNLEWSTWNKQSVIRNRSMSNPQWMIAADVPSGMMQAATTTGMYKLVQPTASATCYNASNLIR